MLHAGPVPLAAFYLREALCHPARSRSARGRISRADLRLKVDILVALGLHGQAERVLARVHAPSDPFVQLATGAGCFSSG